MEMKKQKQKSQNSVISIWINYEGANKQLLIEFHNTEHLPELLVIQGYKHKCS